MILINNVIDFDEVVSAIAPRLATMTVDQIRLEFEGWFWNIQDSEYCFYTQAQVDEHIEYLKEKFLEEYYIYPHVIASQLGMEVVTA
ncbi:MAG: hypothetical protein HWQ38_19005 [Nostoc sp. NMS7]|uniref:hypothetical protein n=1 Tax=Nostoc sp. NMS7 TaxID=2815391 RepID=UPI0025EA9337|nr:hypothetical protein [Nostoc sp. NMS7]MBN3948426.1 hypothetical protein [Nostoc sp. NMS7]